MKPHYDLYTQDYKKNRFNRFRAIWIKNSTKDTIIVLRTSNVLDTKAKFKQLTIQSISTKRTITFDLKSLNKKDMPIKIKVLS